MRKGSLRSKLMLLNLWHKLVKLVLTSGPSGVHVQLLVVKGRRCEPELVYHLTGHTAAAL